MGARQRPEPEHFGFPRHSTAGKNWYGSSFTLDVNSVVTGGLTFDSNKNLWVAFCDSLNGKGYLVEETQAGLRHLVLYGSAKFSAVIQDPSSTNSSPEYLSCPRGLRFDPAGNFWVEVGATFLTPEPALIEYGSSQLLASGSPVPVAVIETPETNSAFTSFTMTFDSAGNLWVAPTISGVVEYTGAQLAAGIQTAPYQTLNIGGVIPALIFPSAVTFDASGNLWVTMSNGGTHNAGGLEMFAAAELSGSGTITPTPARIIMASSFGAKKLLSSFAGPDGLAFDSAGDLWVVNPLQPKPGLGSSSLVEFSAAALTTSGSPVPQRAILANPYNTNLNDPGSITFGPALP
jgi:hypothetical protein